MNDPAYQDALSKAAKAPDPGKRSVAEPTDDQAKPPAAAEVPPPTVIAIRPEAGRKIRVPQQACAFAVAPDLVVTAAGPLENATEIELQSTDGSALKAAVVRKDDKSGLALLRITRSDKPLPFFALADAFAGGNVQCAAFPTVDLFSPTAELLTGSGEAVKDGWTVKLNRNPRLPGSPLIAGTKVIGVVLAGRETPADQLNAVGPAAIKALVGADAGTGPGTRDAAAALLQLTAFREIENR
jgi:hypothetical protein